MAGNDAPPPSMASGMDRISALPEGIREHVLSFLPAHEAVRTTVLARSWRDLWMGSPKLCIYGWGNVDKFCKFVFRLLRLRRGTIVSRQQTKGNRGVASAPLDYSDFSLSPSDFNDEEVDVTETMVNSWIQCALSCQVHMFSFVWNEFDERLTLQSRALVSEHLTCLYLAGIHVYDNLDLSSCPALLDLTIDDSFLTPEEIWSPSLQHLTMTYSGFLLTRTRICVPSLVSLQFTDCVGRCPLLEGMPPLATAVVKFGCGDLHDRCNDRTIHGCGSEICQGCQDYYGPHNDHKSCLLLKALSEAKHLVLSSHPDMFVFSRDIKNCPTFSNLKTLVLGNWFVADDFSGLIRLLQNSPILEKLTLQLSKVRMNSVRTEGTCKLLEQPVVSDHLRAVEIECKELGAMVAEIMKILTACGIPLEQINIQCSPIRSGCVNLKCVGLS